MAKKKNIKQADLMSLYMDYVLTHNQQPKSVYSFSKDNNFEEQKFYEHFNSFEALEKSIFKAFFNNTYDVLQKSEDYQSFDARNKLLSFYYTFFEVLTANRSYIIHALENEKNKLKTLKTLSSLKSSFTKYVSSLDIKTLDLKEEKLDKLQKRSIEESAWIQLLMTIKFWIDDTSKAFEKTDVFIEKSVNTSFDLIDTTPLKSLIDFGKFIYKEKFKMNA
jgi:hypothetical protein